MWSMIILCVTTLFIISIIHWVYRWRNPKFNGTLPPGSMGFPLIGETIEFFLPSKSLDVPPFIKKRIARSSQPPSSLINDFFLGPNNFLTPLGSIVCSAVDSPFTYTQPCTIGFVKSMAEQTTSERVRKRGSLEAELFFKYGPLFRTSLVGRPVVVSSDPEVNYFIFQQEGKLVELWYMDSFSKLLGQDNETIAATGYIHKYLRNLILNHFGPESLKQKLLPKLEDMARQTLQSWSTRTSVEVKEETASMVFDCTSKQLFSYDITKSSEENMSKKFTNFLQGLLSFPLNIPGTAFHKCLKNQKKALRIMKAILEERCASFERNHGDFLDQVVDDMKDEKFLTEDFIVYLMFGLLLASFETISSTLTLAVKLLTDHPLVLKELTEEHEEICRSRENMDSGITWKEYKSMTFTSHVMNETLRLANVAPGILRRVIKDIPINGYTIPAGWTIMVVPSSLQLNPEKFKDPLAFNPWRWKDIASNTTAKSFIPFGGGARSCAGAEFSKVLMAIFLHELVTKYRWIQIKGGEILRTPALGFGNGFHIKVSEKNK